MSQLASAGNRVARYRGLRMSADEYLALSDDGFWYELVDGVVCMSPSPAYWHQRVTAHIVHQIALYLDRNPIGVVVAEVDVRIRDDLVYRPDVIFLSTEKASKCHDKVREIPDIVVEVISPDSGNYDTQTKRNDYEAAGVAEYWLIDPRRDEFHFLSLREGRYQEAPFGPARFASTVLPGFELNLERLRKLL